MIIMTDVPPRLSAALVDRYRVDRELGAGGMATVYLAHDLKHQRDVAIKVAHPDLGAALGGERFCGGPVVRLDGQLTLALVQIQAYDLHGGWTPGRAPRRQTVSA